MFRDSNALRVGRWLVRALLAAGLLFLAAGGRARASEAQTCDEATRLLLAPESGGAAERAREARDILAVDRNRKLAVISSALVDLGIHASLGASPVKLLQSAGDLGRGLLDWSSRTRGEDRALLLLAPDALGGVLDATTRELYDRLEGRERQALARRLLEDGQRALAGGQLGRARIAIDRALELDPGSDRGDALLDALETSARRERALPAEELAAAPPLVASWEPSVVSALLVDADVRAERLAPAGDASAELASAAARYESGERAEALDEFRRIARQGGHAAATAREILADRAVNPERALDDEISSYTKRRSLGWLGGKALADHGLALAPENLELSSAGFRAWKSSYKLFRRTVNPVNLLIDAPARVWHGWRPDGSALREAATRYLELEPHGARADDARAWLERLGKDERESPRVSPFRDGYFVLPHARTRYVRVAPQRVVVSVEALARTAPELARELGLDSADAYVLGDRGLDAQAKTIDSARALELLARVADGLEEGELQPRGQSQGDVLEAVRRLDARVRSGATLRAAPRVPDAAAGLGQLGEALVDGKRARTIGDIALSRKDDKIVADRELGGDGSFCLADTPCIDRKLPVDGELFAQTSGEGSAGVGARADYRAAQLSVEMGTSGPHASLVLPIARWLGIAHLVPVEAHVDLGLDGLSAGPRLDSSASREGARSL